MLSFLLVLCAIAVAAPDGNDPYASLSPEERTLLKPQIERWVRDQVKQDWADLWEIQDQTPELKNEILLGHKDAPDMNREQYVAAMRETMGSSYPAVKAFRVTEVDKEADGFQLVGCAKLQREDWKQTSVDYIHIRIENGKALFGWFDPSADKCKL